MFRSLHNWSARREIGCKFRANDISKHLFGSIRTVRTWNPLECGNIEKHLGAVFNFDFSPEGSLLVAACEKKGILLFDPHNGRLINWKDNIHTDCVNCVRFLDSRLFATCSDDSTVSLWDSRFTIRSVMTLSGHSSWVKNIEYAQSEGLLLTSGFDGSIFTWDINANRSEKSVRGNCIFHMEGLMRSKLTSDNKKLIMSTSNGLIIIIHDLDLDTMPQDIKNLQPQDYRFEEGEIWKSQCDNSIFTRKRNRVEFVRDFPPDNDADMISSLSIHPQGWCIVSRNTSADDMTEWTCVHNIQGTVDEVEIVEVMPSPPPPAPPVDSACVTDEYVSSDFQDSGDGEDDDDDDDSDDDDDDDDYNSPRSSPSDYLDLQTLDDSSYSSKVLDIPGPSNGSVHLQVPPSRTIRSPQERGTTPWCVYKNKPRLLHYCEESNSGRGYIKEICFSPDGRVVCSPFAFGFRLLGFDSGCSELCDCVNTEPTQLVEIASNSSHKNVVLSAMFSPIDPLVVTGCLGGKVVFHQPFW